MELSKIHALLVEASTTDEKNRDDQIYNELFNSIKIEYGPYERGLKATLHDLFYSTVKNAPEKLPSLLPVFALICGDKDDDSVFSKLNWDEIKNLLP